jgi:hypothetical protein
MSLSVNPPYPIFSEADGQPLENGYIWIGAANLDPQTNPINVYWDSGLTLLAAQPIRTLNGYAVYNGTPSRFYASGNYSIRVMNKNGNTIYTSLSGNAFVNFGGTEVITATANQTIFNLSFSYGIGTNSLFVFVNGSKQIVTLNYTESSGTSVTFLTGLNVGDVVEFISFY